MKFRIHFWTGLTLLLLIGNGAKAESAVAGLPRGELNYLCKIDVSVESGPQILKARLEKIIDPSQFNASGFATYSTTGLERWRISTLQSIREPGLLLQGHQLTLQMAQSEAGPIVALRLVGTLRLNDQLVSRIAIGSALLTEPSIEAKSEPLLQSSPNFGRETFDLKASCLPLVPPLLQP